MTSSTIRIVAGWIAIGAFALAITLPILAHAKPCGHSHIRDGYTCHKAR